MQTIATFGGRRLKNTTKVCNTEFEYVPDFGAQSIRRSMSSTTIRPSVLFWLSVNDFVIAEILSVSEYPTMLSAERNLMNGYPDFWAIDAASAVLPDPGGPYSRILERVVQVEVRTWSTTSLADFRISWKRCH